MTNSATANCGSDSVWLRYRDNFPRHLLGVTRYLQTGTMRTLTLECGHRDLRLNFEPYMAMIGSSGARLSDIADTLGISRQAANQTANQIEAAGYIRRKADPGDGRAKLAVLTGRGRALRRDGIRVVGIYHQQFAAIAGKGATRKAVSSLRRLCLGLDLLPYVLPAETYSNNALLGALLPRISDHISIRLMQLTAARGHPALRLSFGQVLLYIGPQGGRIRQIAAINGVSKQAISTIAWELEKLGYICREQDPADARQLVLQFTERGRSLIADSVAGIDDLNGEFAEVLGKETLTALQVTMATLYRALHLEEDVFDRHNPTDIHALATQLNQQLGTAGARRLGRLLLAPAHTKAP